MSIQTILTQIDAEIARLKEAKSVLTQSTTQIVARLGKPRGADAVVSTKPAKKKRNISAEGRARIAAAQSKRWAKLKGK
jgi:hypothetical protein